MRRFCYYVPFVTNLRYFDKMAPASYDFLGVNFYVSTRTPCGFQAGTVMVVAKKLQWRFFGNVLGCRFVSLTVWLIVWCLNCAWTAQINSVYRWNSTSFCIFAISTCTMWLLVVYISSLLCTWLAILWQVTWEQSACLHSFHHWHPIPILSLSK